MILLYSTSLLKTCPEFENKVNLFQPYNSDYSSALATCVTSAELFFTLKKTGTREDPVNMVVTEKSANEAVHGHLAIGNHVGYNIY